MPAAIKLRGRKSARRISLALQGGGAHGAFTWGVLDRLLEDGRAQIEGISGTSAGAMNAVALAHGLLNGGVDAARASLQEFWLAIAASMPFDPALPSADGKSVEVASPLRMLLRWSALLSPEQLNPLDINPMRRVLSAQIDFERLRRSGRLKLFIAATHANSGKLRLFRTSELSVEAVLASACLPSVHRPVEVDGQPYWDGGYAANPAVFPLFYECAARDIVMVLLAPLEHDSTPATAREIRQRSADFAFNATFLREMRMFAYLRDYAERTPASRGHFERRVMRTRFHMIEAQDMMKDLAAETRMLASRQLFEMLRDLGRTHALGWLRRHSAQIGIRSTIELGELFY